MDNNQIIKNKKESKSLIIIIILILMIIILAGYLVYDKMSNKEDKISSSDILSSENIISSQDNVSSELKILSIDDFPTENDSDIKKLGTISNLLTKEELNSNFKNLEKEKNGVKLNFTCIKLEDAPYSYCSKIDIIINENKAIRYDYYPVLEGCSGIAEIFLTNKHIITILSEGCIASSIVTIYDSNGDQQYYDDTIRYSYGLGYAGDFKTAYPTIKNNKLYFIKIAEGNYPTIDENNLVDLEFSYIDLNSSELKETLIQSFKGRVGLA